MDHKHHPYNAKQTGQSCCPGKTPSHQEMQDHDQHKHAGRHPHSGHARHFFKESNENPIKFRIKIYGEKS